MKYTPAQIRKATLAALGVVAQVLAVALTIAGLIPAGYPLLIATLIVGVAQVFGVYRVPNSGVPRPAETAGPTNDGTWQLGSSKDFVIAHPASDAPRSTKV